MPNIQAVFLDYTELPPNYEEMLLQRYLATSVPVRVTYDAKYIFINGRCYSI